MIPYCVFTGILPSLKQEVAFFSASNEFLYPDTSKAQNNPSSFRFTVL